VLAKAMTWAMRFAVKTMIFGIGAVGTVAALSGKDTDSPQAQMMSAMRQPSVVCSITPMPKAQCECVTAAMADKEPAELIELIQMTDDDPRKQALGQLMAEKCGHLTQVQ
jgi:hypothetical protein